MYLRPITGNFDIIPFLLLLFFLALGASYLTGIVLSLFYFTSGEVDKLQKAKRIVLFSFLLLILLGLIIYLITTFPLLTPTKPPGG